MLLSGGPNVNETCSRSALRLRSHRPCSHRPGSGSTTGSLTQGLEGLERLNAFLLTKDNGQERERKVVMKKNTLAHAVEGHDSKSPEKEVPGLNETLQRVDKMVEQFYEIHGPHIKDQGHNP